MQRNMLTLLVAMLVLACGTVAQALDIVWDGTQWAEDDGMGNPILVQSYNVGGITVDMQVGGSTGDLVRGPSYYLPTDNWAQWVSWNIQGLWLAATNLTAGEVLTLDIQFSQPVTGLSFDIYDLDYWNGRERVQAGACLGGTIIAASSVVTGQYVDFTPPCILEASAGSTAALNPDDPQGRNKATLTYNDPIDSLQLSFDSCDGTQVGVLLGNLTFVPEPVTLGLLGLGALVLRRRCR